MKCFVIMPFGDPKRKPEYHRRMEQIYVDWIKPTVEGIELPGGTDTIACCRADQEEYPGEIIARVIENIAEADIVIADLSGRNANVFYELGVRHATSNRTILIADSIDDVPFDLRGQRTIPYTYDPEGMLRLKSKLTEAIRSILLSRPDRIDNPVRRHLLNREKERLASAVTPPGFDAVRSILGEMAELKENFAASMAELRSLVRAVTDTEAATRGGPESGRVLASLVGAWRCMPSGSTYYVRVWKGKLYAPYCYMGDEELTGTYFDLRIVGDRLYGRFTWFDRPIAGFGVLKIVDDSTMEGGWWYDSDVPESYRNDYTRLGLDIPKVNRYTWSRLDASHPTPLWAEAFYRNLQDGRIDIRKTWENAGSSP